MRKVRIGRVDIGGQDQAADADHRLVRDPWLHTGTTLEDQDEVLVEVERTRKRVMR